MKKLLFSLFLIVLCLACFCLSSCKYKDKWFLNKNLEKCLVSELPKVTPNFINDNNEDIYVKFTESEYKSYVNQVFDYLTEKNFKYLGTRGELSSSLSGAFNTYYFKSATCLSDFCLGSGYIFVYSDGIISNGNGELTFCIITISNYGFSSNKVLKYWGRSFAYNTKISLRFNSEAPLSGRYVLPEEEHEHTFEWLTNEQTHQKKYTCGCNSTDIAELHVNNNGDNTCDVCDYYFQINYNLIELESWLTSISPSEIKQIKISNRQSSPYGFNKQHYLTNKSAIESLITELNEISLKRVWNVYPAPGAGSMSITVEYENGNKKFLTFSDGLYQKDYLTYQLTKAFSQNYIKNADFSTLSFITCSNEYDYFDTSSDSITGTINLSGYEFNEYNCDLSGTLPNGYCIHEAYTAYFYNDGIFKVVDSYQYIEYVFKLEFDAEFIINERLSNTYFLNFEQEKWLYEPLSDFYVAGQTVEVKITSATDLGFLFLLNGKLIPMSDYDHENGYYWIFKFEMPSKNSEIQFKTYDGFLPDQNHGVLLESYLLHNYSCLSASIRIYLGVYDSGAIAGVVNGLGVGYDATIGSETIDGVTFNYNDSNRIIVCYNKKIYTLLEAYENGYLTNHDLLNILDLHKQALPYMYT